MDIFDIPSTYQAHALECVLKVIVGSLFKGFYFLDPPREATTTDKRLLKVIAMVVLSGFKTI